MNTETYMKMIMDLNMPPLMYMDNTTPQEETQQPMPVDMSMINQASVEVAGTPAMTL
jgi:hypothetical protein